MLLVVSGRFWSRDDAADVCVGAVGWVEVMTGFDELLKFGCQGSEFALTGTDVDKLLLQ